MARDSLTGTRIRDRRLVLGLKQADLARKIGISASYLNLIEHNRRRIAGKVLIAIAQALEVETSALTEGAEATLLTALREADMSAPEAGAEMDRVDEFAGRFPGWAALIAAQSARIADLERHVDGLADRLTHDPVLASSVHEVLSTAASIRSTASILAETEELGREWLERFHGNINEDSARLADSSRALAAYLENEEVNDRARALPQQEVDALLDRHHHHFDQLERHVSSVDGVLDGEDLSVPAHELATQVLAQYQADAQRLPAARLRDVIAQGETALDPIDVARRADAPIGLVLRRLACLPELQSGYVLCDRSGSLLLRKGLAGFSLPRFGATCPLWPVFQALSQPGVVIHQRIIQLGLREMEYDCYAIAEPAGHPVYNLPPLIRSGMLILPVTPGIDRGDTPSLKVGSTCRVCPRETCAARREPSILDPSSQVL